MQNKAKSLDEQMNVSDVSTAGYENICLRIHPQNKAKQSQNKAKQTQIKPILSQNKPKQSQIKPNQTQSSPLPPAGGSGPVIDFFAGS